MSELRQGWLVAVREMRERSRSRAFRASVVVMALVVLAIIVLPSVLDDDDSTRDVGLAGTVPAGLQASIERQGRAVGTRVRVHRFDTVADGEAAARDDLLDVLVVDARRLEWADQTDEELQAVVAGAIQLVSVRQRAVAAGIDADVALGLLAPVRITNVELGAASGRTSDDEGAAFIMTVILFLAISTYGGLVLTGVVEEKSNRVVEVLLARMRARTLLAGKVLGIGLLGLVQFGATALVALIALLSVESVDAPAARGSVLAWLVVWFVLGYALYAVAYGVLGSLASRTEDAQSAAGPAMVVMVAGYFASIAAVGQPEGALAIFTSYFPATAPMSMPGRFALGAVGWWEPIVSAAIVAVTIVGLVRVGGRVYTSAILHSGPALKLRDAWRGSTASAPRPSA